MSVAENVSVVRQQVAEACGRAGRDPRDVRIVAVAKGQPVERIMDVKQCGIVDVGENRAQELRDKVAKLGDAVRWHYVGSIQTNKARYLDPVTLVHSVDRANEAEALDRRGELNGRAFDVLIEVNVAGERQKQGVRPESVETVLEAVGSFPHVRVRGLMVMAPQAENPEDVRWVFAEGRRLLDRFRGAWGALDELSMGMTDDFEVAVEEGATIVRIGRAIFREGTRWPGSGRKR